MKTTLKYVTRKSIPENNGYLLKEPPLIINGKSNGLVTETDDSALNVLRESESKYRSLPKIPWMASASLIYLEGLFMQINPL